jgi:hypothetical protein
MRYLDTLAEKVACVFIVSQQFMIVRRTNPHPCVAKEMYAVDCHALGRIDIP